MLFVLSFGAGKRVGVLAQGQIQPLGVAMTREGHIAVTDCQGKRVRVRWSHTFLEFKSIDISFSFQFCVLFRFFARHFIIFRHLLLQKG